MGMTNLMSENAEKGVEYFEKVVNQSNTYFQYHKGLAYKEFGNFDKAKEIFQSVATYNFNDLKFKSGKQDLKLKVTDNVGNESIFQTTFYRKYD